MTIVCYDCSHLVILVSQAQYRSFLLQQQQQQQLLQEEEEEEEEEEGVEGLKGAGRRPRKASSSSLPLRAFPPFLREANVTNPQKYW
ncbi:hypothetical protein JRQ81_013528 [Phrynocephalus forsythii]|uniref:Uncharacterized protein n=1 Tax=Phrynocephalus forsythii TaxID=171643 RepID=A0A9Q0Y000_9SAUR|nr:hypothetical protein JRQ81_013528 [Phrynocephalus forsythii]